MIFNTPTRYGIVSKLLHWLIAPLILSLIAIGSYMTTLSDENPLYFRLLDLHQAIGLSVFCLFFVKVAWSLVTPNPGQLPTLAGWESLLARIVHGVLLFAMAAIPVFGYLFATGLGDEISIYDVFEIPSLTELNKAESEQVITIHVALAYGIGALIALHILAVVKHHVVDKNEILRRMWR